MSPVDPLYSSTTHPSVANRLRVPTTIATRRVDRFRIVTPCAQFDVGRWRDPDADHRLARLIDALGVKRSSPRLRSQTRPSCRRGRS